MPIQNHGIDQVIETQPEEMARELARPLFRRGSSGLAQGQRWGWINTYFYTIFRGMNIHKSQLNFDVNKKGYLGFWHTAIYSVKLRSTRAFVYVCSITFHCFTTRPKKMLTRRFSCGVVHLLVQERCEIYEPTGSKLSSCGLPNSVVLIQVLGVFEGLYYSFMSRGIHVPCSGISHIWKCMRI